MYQWDTEPEAHESYSQSAMAATNVHDLGPGRAGQGKGKGRGYAATAADATRAEAEVYSGLLSRQKDKYVFTCLS